MSKKNQILEDIVLANLSTYSLVTSSTNLFSLNEGFKTMDIIIHPEQFQLLSGSLLYLEKQTAINAFVEWFKFKNFKKAFQFLCFNTGLVFDH